MEDKGMELYGLLLSWTKAPYEVNVFFFFALATRESGEPCVSVRLKFPWNSKIC